MSDPKQNRRLAKVIAYMLGVAPEEFGLIPDEEGFVKIKELLQALHDEEGWGYVRQATLNELVLTLPEAPFEICDNRIRSRSGTASAPAVATQSPPRLLYTAVRQKAYPHVLQKGLLPAARPRVVLWANKETAEKIGKRRCADSVTLTINTGQAAGQGVIFFKAGENVFLADYIPAGCFSGPALPRDKNEKKPGERAKKTAEAPLEGLQNQAGSFFIAPPPDGGRPSGRKEKAKKEADWKRERKRMSRRGGRQYPDD